MWKLKKAKTEVWLLIMIHRSSIIKLKNEENNKNRKKFNFWNKKDKCFSL